MTTTDVIGIRITVIERRGQDEIVIAKGTANERDKERPRERD